MDEMADVHEQEKMEISQVLIQQGKHDQVEESVKELEKRQQGQIENKQAALDSELQAQENKLTQMINEENNSSVMAEHRNILDKVSMKGKPHQT